MTLLTRMLVAGPRRPKQKPPHYQFVVELNLVVDTLILSMLARTGLFLPKPSILARTRRENPAGTGTFLALSAVSLL